MKIGQSSIMTGIFQNCNMIIMVSKSTDTYIPRIHLVSFLKILLTRSNLNE